MRKIVFPRRKNITTRSWIYANYQTAIFLLLSYQNMPLLVFLISIIEKFYLLRTVITLHYANLLSKRSKPRRHPSLIRGKSLFHLVICSFRVSSPRQRLGDMKHTTRFIIHCMEWKFIWDPIYITTARRILTIKIVNKYRIWDIADAKVLEIQKYISEKNVTESCTSDKECPGSEEASACMNGTCQCTDGYILGDGGLCTNTSMYW